MSNALEMARQVWAEAQAVEYAALMEWQKLGNQTYIQPNEEKKLIAAGLPLPENSYTHEMFEARKKAFRKAKAAAVAARIALDPLVLADMLEKYQAAQK
jgi:hypothetical protein